MKCEEFEAIGLDAERDASLIEMERAAAREHASVCPRCASAAGFLASGSHGAACPRGGNCEGGGSRARRDAFAAGIPSAIRRQNSARGGDGGVALAAAALLIARKLG